MTVSTERIVVLIHVKIWAILFNGAAATELQSLRLCFKKLKKREKLKIR